MTINLKHLQDFFKSPNSEKIIINHINDEIDFFYYELFSYFSKQNNLKISKNNVVKDKTSINLFFSESIYIAETNNKNEIEKLINRNEKYIIFCNYKNFKIFNKKINHINAYNFQEDLKNFISKILKINCDNLLNFLYDYPYLVISEIDKYYINGDNYKAPSIQTGQINHILEIRKKITTTKDDIYKLYENIKKEASIKKFNFLVY